MYEEFVEFDNKVNISYKAALKSFPDQTESVRTLKIANQNLISAPKAWRIVRDKDCAVYDALNSGNNNAGQIELQCVVDRSKQRIIELDGFK